MALLLTIANLIAAITFSISSEIFTPIWTYVYKTLPPAENRIKGHGSNCDLQHIAWELLSGQDVAADAQDVLAENFLNIGVAITALDQADRD